MSLQRAMGEAVGEGAMTSLLASSVPPHHTHSQGFPTASLDLTGGIMSKLMLLVTLLLFSTSACVRPSTRTRTVRASIEQSIARSVEATRTEDIDAYMAEIPNDFVLYDESGAIVGQEQQRADVLRDWSVIPKTIAISTTIDSIEMQGDTAIVHTSGRWERLMLRPDGKTTDLVLTTQKHRETWRETANGWKGYDIKELGGDIFINGKPYKP